MTPERLAQLTRLRHALHQIPEVSGAEEQTAAMVMDFLRGYDPDQLLTGLGGHGVAAVFDGATDGPTVLFRCELDGLPIRELSDRPYRSRHDGRGHLCGHDGHMIMVAALAQDLAAQRPARGRVVLLFQPAEETGKGAAAVIADPAFAAIAPDYAFALHNLPGLPVGQVALCSGPSNCASRGMRIRLTGKTSHAAAPQDGLSPAAAMTQLMPGLVALGQGDDLDGEYALVTLTHARLGDATFGIAPGEGEIWVTLRTVTDARMEKLVAQATAVLHQVCAAQGLAHDVTFDDVFDACANHPDAAQIVEAACAAAGHEARVHAEPQRWSEDFGQFARQAKTAMFWLGAGVGMPQLHNPDYDFPDAAIPVGTVIFQKILRDLLG